MRCARAVLAGLILLLTGQHLAAQEEARLVRAQVDSLFARWCNTALPEYRRVVDLSMVFVGDSTLTEEQASTLARTGGGRLTPSVRMRQLASAWFARGLYWQRRGQLDSGLAAYRRAGDLLARLGAPEAGPLPKAYAADLYLDLGHFTEAVLTMQPAAQAYILSGDSMGAADAIWTIAESLHQQGNLQASVREYRRMLGLLPKAQRYRRFVCLRQIAANEAEAGHVDSAFADVQAAEAMVERNEIQDQGLDLPVLKAHLHLMRGECAEAKALLQPVLRGAGQQQVQHTAGAQLDLARACLCLGDVAMAITYADSSAQWTVAQLTPLQQVQCYRVLADAYGKQGRTAQALAYMNRYAALKDSVTNAASIMAANDAVLGAAFQREQIADSMRVARAREQERAATAAAIQRIRLQRIAYAGAAVLIAIIAVLLLNRARLKRRIQVEQLRARLSRDLHDDIGSTLSSINILSRMAHGKAEAAGDHEALRTLERISERSQRLLRDMNDIVWSVDPAKDSVEDLVARMRSFAASVLEPKGITFQLDAPAALTVQELPMELKNDLYLIFKEAVNNAAKHARCTEVKAALGRANGHLHLSIADNGIGFSGAGAPVDGGGNGVRNMRQRAEERGGRFTAASSGAGVDIEVSVPLD